MLMLFAQVDRPVRGVDFFLRENWRVLLPMAIGFLGIYLFLPRAKRTNPLLAGAVAAAGLVLAGLWWTRHDAIWVEQLLFYIFAGLAVLGAGLMLGQANPVHAALSFALVVLSSCGLFLLCAAPFLMAATIIIYAGAIVVTFLFVIMLAQQAGVSSADIRTREPFLASMAGFIMLGTLIVILQRGYITKDQDAVVAKLDSLTKIETKDEINALLGEPSQHPTLKFEAEIRDAFPELKPSSQKDDKLQDVTLKVDGLEAAWVAQDVAAVKLAAAMILEHAQKSRQTKGSIVAEKGSPGVLARKPLPAANVAAIGRTMFTDYLVPMEMAGVLLQVATIGAIVIASRKTEGLR